LFFRRTIRVDRVGLKISSNEVNPHVQSIDPSVFADPMF